MRKEDKHEYNFTEKNICIPIKLYSKHIPSERFNLKCDYTIFGHYDGITVDENIFQDNRKILSIWEHSYKNVDLSSQNRNFSQQIIYAMRWDKYGWEKDFDFWTNDALPFLFLCIMQIDHTTDLSKCKNYLEKHIKEHYLELHNNDNIEIICYSSFDDNGLILAMKCTNYNHGIDVINSMHQKNSCIKYGDTKKALTIKYTYTLNGIITSIFENEKYNNLVEKIDNVHLYAIENKSGSIEDLYTKISIKNKERKLIAGNDDECIMINSTRWCDFLPLFSNYDGILNGNSEDYHNATYSIATHLLCSPSESNYFINDDENNADSTSKNAVVHPTICAEISGHLKEIYKHTKKIKRTAIFGRSMTYYKSMSQILNSLQKFEIELLDVSRLDDFTFFMLLHPLNLLALAIRFTLVIENNLLDELKTQKKETIFINTEDYLPSKEIFRFLNGVILIAQNSMHSDRQFMQTPDFNAVVYESPAKLNAYYGSFIKKAKDMLKKDEEKEYEFLIVPGLNEYMVVRKIFDRLINNKRLFILEIPEYQIFDPKTLMPALIHEIAHKVGSKIRSREVRDDKIQELVVNTIIFDILHFLNINYEKEELYHKKLYNTIKSEFSFHLQKVRKYKKENYDIKKKKINSIIIKEFPQNDYRFPDINHLLSNYELDDLYLAAADTLNKLKSDRTFIEHLWKIFFKANNDKSEEITSFYDFNSFIIEAINTYSTTNLYQNINILNTFKQFDKEKNISFKFTYGLQCEISDFLLIFSEVYADIISIISLDLKPNDYFDSIVHNDLQLDPKSIGKSIMSIRVSLVTSFMLKSELLKNESKLINWQWDDLENYSNDDVKHLKNAVLAIFSNVASGTNKSNSSDKQLYIEDIPQILLYPIGRNIIISYIEECIKVYIEDVLKNENNSKLKNELYDMYESACNLEKTNIDALIQKMENYIVEYRENINK